MIVRRAVAVAGLILLGAVVGAVVALRTPASVEIAGTDARIQLHLGRAADEAALSGNLLTASRPTSRELFGEPVGVSVQLNVDPSTFVASDGEFNTDVVPVYVQAYSDPAQLRSDVLRALVRHLLLWALAGAVAVAALLLAVCLVRRWRWRTTQRLGPRAETAVARFLAEQRRARQRIAVALGILVLVLPIAGAEGQPERQPVSRPAELLAGTPFADVTVGGLLRPALVAVRDYIETYFSDTDKYYNSLRDKLTQQLAAEPVQLPLGPDITHVLFVTDRHCNIGMDRVIVAFAQHFGISVLVSGGDDDFSGSFQFESVCTKNLAEKSQRAGMTDVFVAGNHDSALTLTAERRQHVKVLDGSPVTADGLTFVGLPDPRTSRYGQGIRPSSQAAQDRLVAAQGRAAAKVACGVDGPVIAVLHGPLAGATALQYGCGKVTLALDGHTHTQAGPVRFPLPNGSTGYQFTGGSTGGAPRGESNGQPFTSRLTVGPLHHDASMNIVSVDRKTGALIGITVCHITPDQTITFQQLTPTH